MGLRKIYITHHGNLQDKYATIKVNNTDNAFIKIKEKLDALVAFDKERGIESIIVCLDTEVKLNRQRVVSKTDEAQFKNAVDAAYYVFKPHYMVIIGAQDIVPFIRLPHPVYKSRTDYRKFIFSDMPYACNNGYSNCCTDFLAPTRVVSRIPDIPNDGKTSIQPFLDSLENVTKIPLLDAPDYLIPWAVCTNLKTTPTSRILDLMYEDEIKKPVPIPCPRSTEPWKDSDYKKMVHLHLLNGVQKSDALYGEDETHDCTVAIDGSLLDKKVSAGCIVLEKASYGGQIYPLTEQHLPLVNRYLSNGAACVIGSTNITYSNQAAMNAGDHLLALYFVNLFNHTTGDAFLISMQQLLRQKHLKSANELAMFLSFSLYGDATVFPMGDIKPDFAVPHNPEIYGGYETNPVMLSSSSHYSLDLKAKVEVPKKILSYMESYLFVNYNIKNITRLYCNEIYESGLLEDKKKQYTAYIQKILKPDGTFVICKSPFIPKENTPDLLDEWYVFEGTEDYLEFQQLVIEN